VDINILYFYLVIFIFNIKDDKKVYCIGNNSNGQLGIDNINKSSEIIEIKDISDIDIISGGYYHSIAYSKSILIFI